MHVAGVVSVASHAAIGALLSVSGPAGELAADDADGVGAGGDEVVGVEDGVARPPGPVARLLSRMAPVTATTTTAAAAAAPNRTPAEMFDSMMESLKWPRRGRTCRADGSSARIAS